MLGDADTLLEPEGQLAQAGGQLLESLDKYVAHTQKLVDAGHVLAEDAADFTEQELSQQRVQVRPNRPIRQRPARLVRLEESMR
ncbi:hypothetical protein ACPA9J_08930 [Pseudomonas aeruginosa]